MSPFYSSSSSSPFFFKSSSTSWLQQLSRSVRRWGAAASSSASLSSSSIAGSSSLASQRCFSASIRRREDEKPAQSIKEFGPPSSSQTAAALAIPARTAASATFEVIGIQAFDSSSGGFFFFPLPSSASTSTSDAPSSSSSRPAAITIPTQASFEGSDPFPKVECPTFSTATLRPTHQEQQQMKARRLLAIRTTGFPFLFIPHLGTIGRSSEPNPNRSYAGGEDRVDASGRRKHLVPRSVLFADSDAARQDDDFRPRKSSSSSPSSFLPVITTVNDSIDRH